MAFPESKDGEGNRGEILPVTVIGGPPTRACWKKNQVYAGYRESEGID